MTTKRLTIFTVVVLGMIFPALANAGAPHIPCQYPFVFSDAAVNLVVLPYDDRGLSDASSRSSGTQLALLMQMDALSHILEYGSVGAVQLELTPEDRSPCDVDEVAAKVLGRRSGAQAQIRPGNGVVFVWGLMYEEDDDLYVQTYARFLRRDATEELLFPAGEYKLVAKPSAQLIAFAPRHLLKKDLDRIEAAYLKANVLRQWQSDSAPGEELHGIAKCGGCPPDSRPTGFLVIDRQGDWIQIRRLLPNGQSQQGWIHANTGSAEFELEKYLPELGFLEGAVGYLRSRVDADNRREPGEETGRLSAEQFARFEKFSDRNNEAVAVAVTEQLAGITKMLSSRNYLEGLAQAQSSFNRARQLIPYSPDAITLSAASELNRATLSRIAGEPVTIENPRQVAQQLAQASALAPASKEAMSNLSSYYKVALNARYKGDPANALGKPEIEQQIHNIETRRPPALERYPTAESLPQRQRINVQDLKRVTVPTLPQTYKDVSVAPEARTIDAQQTQTGPASITVARPIRQPTGAASDRTKSNHFIVAAYNLPQIHSRISLAPDLLAGILLRDIQQWNAPEIRKLNPEMELPAIPIVVVAPTQDPELKAALDDYLGKSSIWQSRMKLQRRGQAQSGTRVPTPEHAIQTQQAVPAGLPPGGISILSMEQAAASKSMQFTVLR